jgi:large subunit ribosomal protein LP1
MSSKAEQAVSYAALILADDCISITPEKLQALLNAAGIEDVEPVWTTLFAKALEGKDVKEILTAVATTGPATGEVVGTKIEDGKDGEKVADGDGREGDDDESDDNDMGPFGLFD